MKAALALILIYVGAFLVAIQGSSPTPAQGAGPDSGKQDLTRAPHIDPVKEADIRALLELVGARDQIQDAVKLIGEQYREKLLASVQNSEKNQAFVNTVISGYEKNFDVNQMHEQLVSIYDRHYSDEEIKDMLQFYGSPVGQKVAAEAPKISLEIQEATRATAGKAVKDALQEAKLENPGVGQNARLGNGAPRRFQQQRRSQQPQQQDLSQQSAQQQDQP